MLQVEEGRSEFAFIDFRDTPVGRQGYVQGSSLAVWEVILVAQCYGLDPLRTAEHLQWPVVRVQGAMNYAEGLPGGIRRTVVPAPGSAGGLWPGTEN